MNSILETGSISVCSGQIKFLYIDIYFPKMISVLAVLYYQHFYTEYPLMMVAKKSLVLQLQLFSHVTGDILIFLNEIIIAFFTHQ